MAKENVHSNRTVFTVVRMLLYCLVVLLVPSRLVCCLGRGGPLVATAVAPVLNFSLESIDVVFFPGANPII